MAQPLFRKQLLIKQNPHLWSNPIKAYPADSNLKGYSRGRDWLQIGTRKKKDYYLLGLTVVLPLLERMSYKPNPTVGVLLYLASFTWHNDLRFTHVTSFSSLVLLMNIIFILLLTIHFISDDMSYVTTVIMI